MKKILLVLAMIAASVFLAQPAIAAEGDPGDTAATTEVAASDTPAAETKAEEPKAEEPKAEEPLAEDPPPVVEEKAPAPQAEDNPAPKADKPKQDEPADDQPAVPAAAAAVDLNVKVDICHVPPGNPANAHSISVSYNSIVKGQGHGKEDGNHSLDVIPAFDYTDDGQLQHYPGRNLGTPNPCAAGPALTEVGTEAPLLVAPTCTADGFVELPVTEGVIYTITPANAPGDVDVDATAAPTFILEENAVTHWDFTVLEQLSGQVNCPIITDDPPDSTDVKICHATASFQNPYVKIPPATAGVANGHDGHDGPIFNGVDDGWGDIIEPYTYNGVDYPGQNWTAEGIAIFNNGCNVVTEVVPVPPTVTDADCDVDGMLVVPADTEDITYSQDPEGTGPGDYVVTATATEGNFISGQTEFAVTVDAQLDADDPLCAGGTVPEEPDTSTPVQDNARENDLLPDTGGVPLWVLLLSGPMTAAGLLVLMRLRPVSHSFTSGGGPAYSLIMPPVKKTAPVVATKVEVGLVRTLVAKVVAFFRGGRA